MCPLEMVLRMLTNSAAGAPLGVSGSHKGPRLGQQGAVGYGVCHHSGARTATATDGQCERPRSDLYYQVLPCGVLGTSTPALNGFSWTSTSNYGMDGMSSIQ